MYKGKQTKNWEVIPTAVYYTIQDEDGNLICFMSIDKEDKKTAQRICDLHNHSNTEKLDTEVVIEFIQRDNLQTS